MIATVPKLGKIFPLGHRMTKTVWDAPQIEITEKLDGSQFRFGLIDGHLICGTKNTILDHDNVRDKLFRPAVETVLGLYDRKWLPNNFIFFGETLAKPHHNVIKYGRTPLGNIALFGGLNVADDEYLDRSSLESYGTFFKIDVVRLVFRGSPSETGGTNVERVEFLDRCLMEPSVLSGSRTPVNVEGVVIRNSEGQTILGTEVYPYILAKYVANKFKEQFAEKCGNEKISIGKGGWQGYCADFRTEARWRKAIQHFAEDGKFRGELRDIGALVAHIHDDILSENGDAIDAALRRFFLRDLFKESTRGFAEWYKQELASGEFAKYTREDD